MRMIRMIEAAERRHPGFRVLDVKLSCNDGHPPRMTPAIDEQLARAVEGAVYLDVEKAFGP